LKDTLVIGRREFGRTPVSQGNDGRDHPYGYSIWMAEAAKPGFVYGPKTTSLHAWGPYTFTISRYGASAVGT
jgi:uncharacterized protein (DUF1501 family)